MSNSASIFVDSDVLIGLSITKDAHNLNATKTLELLKNKGTALMTSNYVFSECITVISQKVGRQEAVRFILKFRSMFDESSTIWISEELEELALKVFYKQTSKNTSFVDCTNMAIMKSNGIDTIFSFDKVYQKNGFKLLGKV